MIEGAGAPVAPASCRKERDDRSGDNPARGARDLQELRANPRALGREFASLRRRDPCVARCERRRQVDALAGDLRPYQSRQRRDPVSRPSARGAFAARGARRGDRDGDAGDEPRARSLGAREHLPPRTSPTGAAVASDDAKTSRRHSCRSRPGSFAVARRRGARPFGRPAPTRRDRQGARAQRQPDHL